MNGMHLVIGFTVMTTAVCGRATRAQNPLFLVAHRHDDTAVPMTYSDLTRASCAPLLRAENISRLNTGSWRPISYPVQLVHHGPPRVMASLPRTALN